jgi:phosphoenolpyruvate carboxylase
MRRASGPRAPPEPLDRAGRAGANIARIKGHAETGDFASFAARWGRRSAHIVFTAHPTFLLARPRPAQSPRRPARAISARPPAPPAMRDTITLDSEHDDALAAIARAMRAR